MADRDFIFRFEGEEHRVGDLTLAEAEDLERQLEISWAMLSPVFRAGHRRALMEVFLGRTRSDAEVAKIMGDLKLYDSEKMWEAVDLDLPVAFENGVPLATAEDEGSTPTS